MVKVQKDNELYDVPDELLYIQSIGNVGHVWVRLENEKARIGITDYGQKQLKEIVYLELPKLGSTIQSLVFVDEIPQSKPIGTIESQKTSIDLFSPISGTIEEINDMLENNPGIINQDPYDDGWIILLNPSDLEKEKLRLWSAEKYAQKLEKM